MIKSSGSPPASPAERFVVLKENRLAFTAIERLVKRPARGAPPLTYLYGPAGTGKSHLVRHFLRELRHIDAAARVISFTASEFAADFAEASDRNRIPEFTARFRDCDALLCEDIQSLARKGETQRLFVTLIDQVAADGGRVLLTCSKLPGEIPGLQVRLVNRCRGGALAGITLPELESRVTLLTHFAGARQMAISPEALREIAEARPASPRDLQAVLLQLETAGRHARARLDRAFVSKVLHGEESRPEVSLADVARAVARHFGVKVAELRSTTRQHGLAVPRQCAMYLGRHLTGEPLTRIAAYFGRRNHTAVIHACRRTQSSLADEPALRQNLAQIRTALGVVASEPHGDASDA